MSLFETVVFLIEAPAQESFPELLSIPVDQRPRWDASDVRLLGSAAFTHSDGTDVRLGDGSNAGTLEECEGFDDVDVIVNLTVKKDEAHSYVDYRLRIICRLEEGEPHTYFCEGRSRLNIAMKFPFGPGFEGRRKHLVVWPWHDVEMGTLVSAS